MLPAIKLVSKKTIDYARNGHCDLQTVHNVLEAYTQIDEILYVCYEATSDNPIWGSFERWEQFAPYQGEKTRVEVRYASHLDAKWKRFVVCKELSHSLDGRRGTHTVQDDEVNSLITELSLASASPERSQAAHAEKIAEAAALEILLPLALRKELLVGATATPDFIREIAEQHEIPYPYVALGFDHEYNELIASILAAIPD